MEDSNARMRTIRNYHLDLVDLNRLSDFWQMPKLNFVDFIPSDLIGFNYAKTSKRTDCGIHFFIDDYQFQRVWSDPLKYVDILKQYECVMTPDYSLYLDMPLPIKIWNVYRSRLVGAAWQDAGLRVIPTVSWGDQDTFSFCFEGIEDRSIVAISTVGVMRNSTAVELWKAGVSELLKRLHPTGILLYGNPIPFDFGNCKVFFYKNNVVERLRGGAMMDLNLQLFGGRGASSSSDRGSIANSNNIKNEMLSSAMNSKFKGVQRMARDGTGNYSFKSASAVPIETALKMTGARFTEKDGKTLVDGTIGNKSVFFADRSDSPGIKKLKEKAASRKKDSLQKSDVTITPTSTYDRWKKSNDANFSAWFNGGRSEKDKI